MPDGARPGDGLGMMFQELMGPKRAAYYLYTSDILDAQTALQYGMVNEVLSNERLLPRAWEIAERIRAMPRLTRLMAKQIVRRRFQQSHVEHAAFHLAHELVALILDSTAGAALTPSIGAKPRTNGRLQLVDRTTVLDLYGQKGLSL